MSELSTRPASAGLVLPGGGGHPRTLVALHTRLLRGWFAFVLITLVGQAAEAAPQTRVGLEGGRWVVNGRPTNPGSLAEGLLMNVRMVNAVFEDQQRPEFDPEANADRFIAHLPDYAAQGVNAFTICLQGGMPGYEGAVNSAFAADGSLRPAYLTRVERLIRACDRSGLVVILGLFYQRQSGILKDESAVRAGVENATRWVAAQGFGNVVIEVANEYPHGGFAHAVIRDPAGQAGLIRLVKRVAPGLLVTASGYGDGRIAAEVAEACDFLTPHWNGTKVEDIPARVADLRQFGKPIVCNEDDKTGAAAVAALRASVASGCAYGLMLQAHNQTFPFRFDGAADDPLFYAALKEVTSGGSGAGAPAGAGAVSAAAQTILTPWGNIAGMRVAGEPVNFEAGLRIVHPDWSGFSSAVKYLQRPRYSRTGSRGVVESEIEGLAFKEVVTDTAPGEATLDVAVTLNTNRPMAGVYLCVDLPDPQFAGGRLEVLPTGAATPVHLELSPGPDIARGTLLRAISTGMKISAPRRTLELRWSGPMLVLARRDVSSRPTSLNDPSVRQDFVTHLSTARPDSYQLYLEVLPGSATVGRTAAVSLNLSVRATPDPRPVRVVLDATQPGRRFDGIGGNCRLQFPETDPAVLAYNLDNLRVAWGRLDLPWAEWDPDESADPLGAARAGHLDRKVRDAMETARALAQRSIPVILSAWSPPRWARATSQPPGLRGTALNLDKLDRICASLASYLVHLQQVCGVETAYFSFNEPETGVEVRQTPAEHAEFIKRMGAELAARGLTTKLLLGDTAHGTPAALDFIRPSLADPATHRYIGAVAFHTWRGCTVDALSAWAQAARQLGVPLLITESGPDAHLHEYPGVRLEPWFQLQEIELYVRCCAHAQPATLMEWQLTTDYSVLTGGGVYGESGPLRPTQRFWNLKQLGGTPTGTFALPLNSDRPEVTVAAFGNPARGDYALHLVNAGNERPAVLTGLPPSVTGWRRFVTDAHRGMEEQDRVEARGGTAEVLLPPASFTTLLGNQSQ